MDTIDKCPVCESSKFRRKFSGHTTRAPGDGHKWQVDQCERCGLGFLNPRPNWEELQEFYSEEYPAYLGELSPVDGDLAIVEAALRSGQYRYLPIPKGKRVLDVGVGAGLFLRICSKLGGTVKGVEPSPIAAGVARSFGLDVFNGTLDELKTEERFDIITANQVLEHVPDPVPTLQCMRDLLAPGGLVWLAVPNAACRWAKALGWKWDGADLPYHLLQFTPESLRVAGRRAGLKVNRMYTHSLPDIVAHSMQKQVREDFFIPSWMSRIVFSSKWASELGQKLDEACQGDNLIVEFSKAT